MEVENPKSTVISLVGFNFVDTEECSECKARGAVFLVGVQDFMGFSGLFDLCWQCVQKELYAPIKEHIIAGYVRGLRVVLELE